MSFDAERLTPYELQSLSQLMRLTGGSLPEIVSLVGVPDPALNKTIETLFKNEIPEDGPQRDRAFLAPLLNVLPLMDELLTQRQDGREVSAKVG